MPKTKFQPIYINDVSLVEAVDGGFAYDKGGELGGNLGVANIEIANQKQLEEAKGRIAIPNLSNLQIGNGTQLFGADENGIFLGAAKWSDALFRVSMAGALTANSVDITGGSIQGALQVVETTGNIQDAIDLVNVAGGGTVFLKNGTYTPGEALTLYSNVALEGQNIGSCFIDFENTYDGIKMLGSNAYTTGTLSVSNGGTAVSGSGTSWTSAMIGRNILLGGIWYPIVAVTDGTNLTIGLNYAGIDLSGASYTIATTINNAAVRDLTVKNAATAGVALQYGNNCFIDTVNTQTSAIGINIDDSSDGLLRFSRAIACNVGFDIDNYHFVTISSNGVIVTAVGVGIDFNNCSNISFNNTYILSTATDGINFTDCDNIGCNAVSVQNAGSIGFEFISGNTEIGMVVCAADNCTSDGIKLTATTDRCVITGCTLSNNGGWGINIAASTCDDNFIRGNQYYNNTSGTYTDSGTDTKTDGDFDKFRIFTAGIALTAGNAVFLHTDGKVYSTDDAVAGQYETFIGFAVDTVAKDASVSVWTLGGFKGLTSLTAASIYYLQDATTTKDPSQESTGNEDLIIGTSETQWQSFTTVGTNITKIGLTLGAAVETITIRIREGEGTGGALVGTTTVAAGVTYEWKEPLFDPILTVAASTQYTITLQSNGSSARIRQNAAGNLYAGGRSSNNALDDWLFRIYYTTGRGAIGTSAGSNSKKVGLAISTTELQINYAL